MVEVNDRLTLQEVARELGRSVEQVRRYAREGKLPAAKLGMQWFVERQALEAYKAATGKAAAKDVLARARELRRSIARGTGTMNVIDLLDESRQGHP